MIIRHQIKQKRNSEKGNLLVYLLHLVHITLLNSMNFKAKMTKNKSILQTRDVIIRRFSIKILNIDHSYFKYKKMHNYSSIHAEFSYKKPHIKLLTDSIDNDFFNKRVYNGLVISRYATIDSLLTVIYQ